MFDSGTGGEGSGGYPAELIEHPHWFALQTRARHEKRVHNQLEKAGLESFPAVAPVEREWSDRTRRVRMPLFPGYIFVKVALGEVAQVLRWPGAVDLVRSQGVPVPVRREEMEAVRRLVAGVAETGGLPEPASYLSPGQRVQVVDGPFQGLEGILLEVRGGPRVSVRFDALRQAKAVKVSRELLAPLGTPQDR